MQKQQQLIQTCSALRLALRNSYATLEHRYSPVRDTFIARSQGDINLIEVSMEAIIRRSEFIDRDKGRAIIEAADQKWRVVEELRRRGVVEEDDGGVIAAGELQKLVVENVLRGVTKYLVTGCAN